MPKCHVDQNLCIGCGACIEACPDTFEFGEDGKSQAKYGECNKECDYQEIIKDCPVGAISVEG